MKVNEIFYSLQGEGHYTGTPAIFIRLSGCNLRCWFCDTDHSSFTDMSEEQIVREALRYPSRHVVITGGEPTMQIDKALTDLLHKEGFFIQVETNGSLPLKEGAEIDWITCSPKGSRQLNIQRIDEVKVVYEAPGMDMAFYENIAAKEYRLQPCDTKDPERNKAIVKATIDYVLSHPKWKLSLQTHKIMNIR